MAARSKNVAIIGAGICGVSTAICLQEADPSLQLTIVAEKFSPDLTSDGAAGSAGLWSVVPRPWMKDTAKVKHKQWGEATFHYLKRIVDTAEAYRYQMNFVTGFILYDEPVIKDSLLKDVPLLNKRLSKEELTKNFPPDLIDGLMTKMFVFPGTPYLQMNLKRFQENGGKVVQRKVKSFDEFAGKFDVVVNCTGLGARELCNDDKIAPVRGHIIRMHAPWIKHFYYIRRKKDRDVGNETYIIPRFNDVIVGGTAQLGNWSTEVDENETQSILDRVEEFEPTIKKAAIIKQWVGLRPVRDTVRLEKELMDVTTQHGTKFKLTVVHNYGHGSEGLSLFWGCALEARDLILSFLNRNCP